jgi:hypothetical protein
MAERFTKEQKLLEECMKYLIQLYYLDKARPPEKIWYFGEIRDTLMRLYERLYGEGECKVGEKDNDTLSISHPERPGLRVRYFCYISSSCWSQFIAIMDELIKAVDKNQRTHFPIFSRTYELTADVTHHIDLSMIGESPSNDPEAEAWKLAKICSRSRTIINKLASPVIRSGEITIYKIDSDSVLQIVPKDFLWVGHRTQFAEMVLHANGDTHGDGDVTNRPHQFSSLALPQGQFIEVIQALLINFDLEFAGYDRIKSCRQCEKIFFEKKKGAGQCCSDKCRSRFDRVSEPEQKRLCRLRQNQWLGYQYNERIDLPIISWKLYESPKQDDPKKLPQKLPEVPMYDYVKKGDCTECDLCVRTGECSILYNRNPKVVTAIKESLRSIREEKHRRKRITQAKKR